MSEEENEEKEDENEVENHNEKKIDINLNKNKVIDFTMGNFTTKESQKSISQILSDVNFEMNSLSNQINSQFIYNKYKTFHNDNIDNLLKEKFSNQIIDNENLREITLIQNSLDNIILFNKTLQGSLSNFDKNFTQQFPYQSSLNDHNLYESYKNNEYYSSFNLNSNNNFNTYPNVTTNLSLNQEINISRMKEMNSLFNHKNKIRKPKIYTQIQKLQNIKIPIKNSQPEFQFTNNFNSGKRSFERIKPYRISNAIDILLNK